MCRPSSSDGASPSSMGFLIFREWGFTRHIAWILIVQLDFAPNAPDRSMLCMTLVCLHCLNLPRSGFLLFCRLLQSALIPAVIFLSCSVVMRPNLARWFADRQTTLRQMNCRPTCFCASLVFFRVLGFVRESKQSMIAPTLILVRLRAFCYLDCESLNKLCLPPQSVASSAITLAPFIAL